MRLTALIFALATALSQNATAPADQELLKSFLEKGAPFDFILIDLRGSAEITAVIGNAECKPYNFAWPVQFKELCEKIPKDAAIFVYCQSGGRSARAAGYLKESGFSRVYDAGGILTWTGPTVSSGEIKPASLLPAPSMRAK
jgi:rhodanese-related sulfurtransferase